MFKNEEGFSLLELVVAVGVAGIIAAVALPTFAGLQDKATTTSATYAASASAAEALANSTMGTTGSVNSSNTGSAANPVSTAINITSSDFQVNQYGGAGHITVNDNLGAYPMLEGIDVGFKSTNWSDIYTYPSYAIGAITLNGLTQEKVDQIVAKLNIGTTVFTFNGNSYTSKSIKTVSYASDVGEYTVIMSSYELTSSYGVPRLLIWLEGAPTYYGNSSEVPFTLSIN